VEKTPEANNKALIQAKLLDNTLAVRAGWGV
jgi:hypothetical protein